MSEDYTKNSIKFTRNHRLRLSFFAGLFIFILFLNSFVGASSETKKAEAVYSHSYFSNIFEELDLDASSVLVYNSTKDEVIYKMNSEESMPLASLAKVMTAVVAMEKTPKEFPVTIGSQDLSWAGDHGLLVGETWKKEDILAFMLTVSSNDAAESVARNVEIETIKNFGEESGDFVYLMNEKSKELGLDLNFANPSGLDVENETMPGATGSAEDISILMGYAVDNYPELFKETSNERISKQVLGNWHHGENTNKIIGDIAGVVASKTGFTDLSGGNLSVVVLNGGEEYILTVLGADFYSRFDDILKLNSGL